MFIPNENIIKVGDRVRLTHNVKTLSGTFTRGHEFNVIGDGERGFDLQDDESRKILECGPFVTLEKVQPLPPSLLQEEDIII